MAIPTLGAMIAAMGSPAEWGAVDTAKLYWDNTNFRLGIGSSGPTSPLMVNGPIRFGSNMTIKTGIYNYTNVDNVTEKYIHFKTNQQCNGGSTGPMIMTRFTGYQYGSTVLIDAKLGFYSYLGNVTAIASSPVNICSAYKSSDSYVVMTLWCSGSIYYLGVSLDLYAICPQGFFDLQVTAATYSANATGVY